MWTIIVGCLCYLVGFATMALFAARSYDKGFGDATNYFLNIKK